MTERSVLRLRQIDHVDPSRKGEAIVEIVRGGAVVATLYGTREGIQVTSHLFGESGEGVRVFFFSANITEPQQLSTQPSVVIPLLAEGEICPWCFGTKVAEVTGGECPVCR